MSRGPEESGHDDERPDVDGDRQRPQREAITPALGHIKGAGPSTPLPARTVRLISGDFLLTVNPVDGSEIELAPPGTKPTAPARRDARERAGLQRAGRPPVPPGPAAPPQPLLERQDERERLAELLGRGRSIRLTGPAGSGRTVLLEAVAADCSTLAPDGVIRLSGHHRTGTELLYELYSAVYRTELNRPDRAELLARVRDIGAVVVVDDLEFGGEALDELLGSTPECAYLFAVAPDAPAASAGANLEEISVGGLGRGASLELLERAVERSLTDEEANWAGDLWFESEGLPLRFVQAGALLRQRDQLRGDPDSFDEFEPFSPPSGDTPSDQAVGYETPLPTPGQGAAPAALLASRLSASARATLRFAVALGGEVPHQAHLPALVGDTHADGALGELMSCALLSPVGTRYRLASGVAAQLQEEGYGDEAVSHAHTAAQHYAWWAGHPSVTPERATAEADAVLASMGSLVPGQESGHPSAAVLLARSAAPAFMAGLHWGAWERALRVGQEAARIAGEVAEEAYFHHELGVLALCVGNLERARAELEASIAMRGALADKSGTVAGRRALALVADRESELSGGRPAGEGPAVALNKSAEPAGGPPAIPLPRPVLPAFPTLSMPSLSGPVLSGDNMTLVTRRDFPAAVPPSGPGAAAAGRRGVFGGARRNLVAAGTGAVLAAVLGTVVTLGATSGSDTPATDKVKTEQSANPDDGGDGLPAEPPGGGSSHHPGGGGGGGGGPTEAGAPGPTGAVGGGTPSGTAALPSGSPSGDAPAPGGGGDPSQPGTPSKTGTSPAHTPPPPDKPTTTPPDSPSSPPSSPPDPPETPPDTPTTPPDPSTPDTTASNTSPSITAGTPTGTDAGPPTPDITEV